MMSREELMKLWDEVKANHQRLQACVGPHDFQPDGLPSKMGKQEYACTKCKGTLADISVHWYKLGLEHARR